MMANPLVGGGYRFDERSDRERKQFSAFAADGIAIDDETVRQQLRADAARLGTFRPAQ